MKETLERTGHIAAVMLAISGDWPGAHAIVDAAETDPTACWIRACMLKAEDKEAEARHWYRRSGQFYECYADIKAELAAIKAALTY